MAVDLSTHLASSVRGQDSWTGGINSRAMGRFACDNLLSLKGSLTELSS